MYYLTSINVSKGIKKSLSNKMKAFLWGCTEMIYGGKCKVNWDRVYRPADLGGLVVLHLDKFSCALRLCWLWLAWTSPERPWVGLDLPCYHSAGCGLCGFEPSFMLFFMRTHFSYSLEKKCGITSLSVLQNFQSDLYKTIWLVSFCIWLSRFFSHRGHVYSSVLLCR